MGRLVCGVGVNDASYEVSTTEGGYRVMCPYYRKWSNMLQRCYNTKALRINPTYKDVTVCEEWLTFSVFKAWMRLQDWRGKHLDKDVIKAGNKEYGPDTCCFITQALNNLLLTKGRKGGLPTGVSLYRPNGKFVAYCNVEGESINLGYYGDVEEAVRVYKKFKAGLIREAAEKQEDYRLRDSLLKHVNHLLGGV